MAEMEKAVGEQLLRLCSSGKAVRRELSVEIEKLTADINTLQKLRCLTGTSLLLSLLTLISTLRQRTRYVNTMTGIMFVCMYHKYL